MREKENYERVGDQKKIENMLQGSNQLDQMVLRNQIRTTNGPLGLSILQPLDF